MTMTVINLPSAWLPIADAVIKATIVLTIAAVASIALRRASAALRHLVWTLALVSALMLPVLSFALPKWQLPVFTVAEQASTVVAEEEWLSAPLTRAPSLSKPTATAATPEPAAPAAPSSPSASAAPISSWFTTVTWQQAIVGLWIAGALLILGRIAVGLAAIRFLSRRTQEITDAAWLPMARGLASALGVGPRLRFLRSGRAAMPIATGIFRPVVIMPPDADGWAETRLRIVLLHELAHVKRRDCLTHLLAQAACAFYWFNPLAWIAVKRARTERERACDDLVLASGTRGSDYADQLIEMARVLRGDRFPALLAGASLAMAHRSQLEGRLMAILDPRMPRAGLSRSSVFTAVALCFVAVASLGALQPWTESAGVSAESPAAAMAEPPTTVMSSALSDVGSAVRSAPTAAASRVLNGGATSPAATTFGRESRVPPAPPVLQPMQPAQSPQPAPMPMPQPMPVPHDAWGQVSRDVRLAAAESIDSRAIAEAVAEAMEHADFGEGRGRGQGKPAAQADPRLIAALTAALKDSDKEVRETAMQALVKMRDPSIFDPLVQALKDSSPDVREAAAHGLGQLRDKRALQPLIAVLKEDTSAGVREQAVHALGQLRDPAAFDGFVVALRDTNAGVREQAVHAIGQLRDKRAVEPLISALKDSNAGVREQAAHALGQLRDPRAIEALIVATKDANPGVREQVVFALGQLRDPRAIDALTAALKDPSADVRQNAAFALGQLVR
jgi:HEAT repeat protein/beta-lactamase regulating signal transducer with metallopeptidase domain